ncbi:hypothetical protein QFC22_001450 [Naganishia vaughanmartiniae]|uniref:Uncharacterized protein n=1 Tax=Naganishia vaughanmartiniae TaxID=1424756 RepID=A0ACC2XIN2_9TREE|nr:hypothetical protein QFC22_001450 [Naganishia vaughanmartiniae]
MPQPHLTPNDGSSTSLLFDIDHQHTAQHETQAGPSSPPTPHSQPAQQEVDMVRRASSSKQRYQVPVLHAEEYALDDLQGEENGYATSSKHNTGTFHVLYPTPHLFLHISPPSVGNNQDYPETEDLPSASSPLLFNGFSSPRDHPAGYEDGQSRNSTEAFRYLLPEGEGAKSTLMAGIANVFHSLLQKQGSGRVSYSSSYYAESQTGSSSTPQALPDARASAPPCPAEC